jgi:predicted outer membrane repeat protein
MQYFQAFTPPSDNAIVSAWDTQLASVAKDPWLEKIVAERGADLRSRFAECYRNLRALPRGARRALQRRLAESGDFALAPERRRRLAYSLAGAALLLALAQEVGAGTINVTAKNPAVSDGDGLCSLSEAIINANNHAMTYSDCQGVDGSPTTINLSKGTQTLITYDNSYIIKSGLPAIHSVITIQGNGAKIQRSKSAPHFRLLTVKYGGDLTLNDVTLRDGYDDYGGAIWNNGHLTINSSTITGNVATNEGGGVYSRRWLHISDTTLSKNRAVKGGAVSNYGYTVDIQNSIITGNSAERGGGIHNRNYYANKYSNRMITLTIDNTEFSKNSASSYGGGLEVQARTHRYYYYESYYNGCGCGIFQAVVSNTRLMMTNSTITGNKAVDGGGGAYIYGAYAYLGSDTIAKNSAGVNGGGLYGKENLDLYLENSTISGNKAVGKGGGVAVVDTYYNVDVSSGDTFVKNKAAADATTNDKYY